MTNQNGSERPKAPVDWGSLPPQPPLTSDRIKALLSKAPTSAANVAEDDAIKDKGWSKVDLHKQTKTPEADTPSDIEPQGS